MPRGREHLSGASQHSPLKNTSHHNLIQRTLDQSGQSNEGGVRLPNCSLTAVDFQRTQEARFPAPCPLRPPVGPMVPSVPSHHLEQVPLLPGPEMPQVSCLFLSSSRTWPAHPWLHTRSVQGTPWEHVYLLDDLHSLNSDPKPNPAPSSLLA